MLETEFKPGTNADLYLKMLVESAQDLIEDIEQALAKLYSISAHLPPVLR